MSSPETSPKEERKHSGSRLASPLVSSSGWVSSAQIITPSNLSKAGRTQDNGDWNSVGGDTTNPSDDTVMAAPKEEEAISGSATIGGSPLAQ